MGGGPVSAFMSETSLDQFFKWRAHRERELSEPTRLEIYLASIRHQLFEIPFMVWGKESKVKEDKFRIKFTFDGKPTEESKQDEEEIRRRSAEQTFSIMEGVLGAVAHNQRPGIDPSAGYLLQTTFDNGEQTPVRDSGATPPLSPTEPEKAAPAQSYATGGVLQPPPIPQNPKPRKWTGGPQ